jgi:hypothetical protein
VEKLVAPLWFLKRRVIVDLSFSPEGLAVNDGISKDLYLGEKVSVHYPTVDDFVRLKIGSPFMVPHRRRSNGRTQMTYRSPIF